MACSVTHLWLGLKVWQEIRRRAAAKLAYDLDFFPEGSRDVKLLADSAPKRLLRDLLHWDPIRKPDSLGRLALLALVVLGMMSAVTVGLARGAGALVVTLRHPVGSVVSLALASILAGLFLWAVGRRVYRFIQFCKLLCELGRHADEQRRWL